MELIGKLLQQFFSLSLLSHSAAQHFHDTLYFQSSSAFDGSEVAIYGDFWVPTL